MASRCRRAWEHRFVSTFPGSTASSRSRASCACQFTAQRPVSFWEQLQASEYGFWANVNPDVPHPRWSQATEQVLGTDERIPTLLFNGYGEQVAALYAGLEAEKLYM